MADERPGSRKHSLLRSKLIASYLVPSPRHLSLSISCFKKI
jgi:hypothetical protein